MITKLYFGNLIFFYLLRSSSSFLIKGPLSQKKIRLCLDHHLHSTDTLAAHKEEEGKKYASASSHISDYEYVESRLLNARQARLELPLALTYLFSAKNAFADELKEKVVSEDPFEMVVDEVFPGSLANSELLKRLLAYLKARKFEQGNTLLGSSLDPDEINSTPNSLIRRLNKEFGFMDDGGTFPLGGLAGFPFAGTAGFQSFFSHCPEQGKVLLVFGPNVGVSADGTVGMVERIGQGKASTCCGALVGALKAIALNDSATTTQISASNYQQNFLIRELSKKKSSKDDILSVTRRAYEMSLREVITQIQYVISTTPSFWDKVSEVVVVGGIIVNRGHGEGLKGGDDYFQPLTLKCYNGFGNFAFYDDVFGDLRAPRNYAYV